MRPQDCTTIAEFREFFGTQDQCIRFIERTRWPDGFVCRFCGEAGAPYLFCNRPLMRRCRSCRKDSSLIAGTMYHRSKWPLTDLFLMHYLLARHPEISTSELCRQMERKEKGTQWATVLRLRKKIERALAIAGPSSPTGA